MAIRLGDYVQSGYLDNSVKGKVSGKLVFDSCVVTLDLDGITGEDIAGCVFKFSNPYAQPLPASLRDGLDLVQVGHTGDISASEKRKILNCFPEKPQSYKNLETHLDNILYLEWYSESNGRCVIEGVKYDHEIDLPRWKMTEEEVKEQRLNAKKAFEEYTRKLSEGLETRLEEIRERRDEIPIDADDEYAWEARLKAHDQMLDEILAEDYCDLDPTSMMGKMPAKTDEEAEKLLPLDSAEEWVAPEPPLMSDAEWDAMNAEIKGLESYVLDEDLQVLVDAMRLITERLVDDYVVAQPIGGAYEQLLILVTKVTATMDSMYDEVYDQGLIIANVKREIERVNQIIPLLQEKEQEQGTIKRLLNLRSALTEFNRRLRGEHL